MDVFMKRRREREQETMKHWNTTLRWNKKRGQPFNQTKHDRPPRSTDTKAEEKGGHLHALLPDNLLCFSWGRVYSYITHSSSYFSYFSSAWFKFGVLSVVWKYAFFFSMRVGSRGSLPPWLPVRLVRVFSARSSPLLRGSRFRRHVPFLPHSWTLI